MWQMLAQLLPAVIGMMNKGTTTTTNYGGGATGSSTPYNPNGGFLSGMGNILGKFGGLSGGGSANSTPTSGGQTMQPPANQFIPPQMMQSRQMPSYGGIIEQMLSKYRG
jgi:hypothetical protein